MASHIYKLAVHKNKEAETMANYFENTPKYNKWTAKSVLKVGFWAIVVPITIYRFVLPAYVRTKMSKHAWLHGRIENQKN